jgi:hypothetical protein
MATADSTGQQVLFDTGPVAKRCTACGKTKPLDEFSWKPKEKNRPRAYRASECKQCAVRRVNNWTKKNPAKRRASLRRHWLKSKYGLSQAEYDSKLAAQGGVCAICGETEIKKYRDGVPHRLSVDHDHQTKKIRHLLCQRCNTMLGASRDSPNLLRKAADYLESFR